MSLLNMNTRFNYKPIEPRDNSHDDEFYKWSYEKKIRVLNNQKDGSVDNYVEEDFWKSEKCSWEEFIKSYDIGSIQEQVMNHITKGTPLVTEHTLPAGDYTQLEKGAAIKREMAQKGITQEMLVQAVIEAMNGENNKPKVNVKDGE